MKPTALRAAALALLLATAAPAQAADPATFGPAVRAAQARWEGSPHGPMLERILPPTFAPRQLPEPRSPGAALAVRYCVQCHNLPNPAMHHAEKWPKVVTRMVERMRGKGNMGVLMKDMMAGLEAPGAAEEAALVDYLKRHAQTPLDPRRYPDAFKPSGEPFRLACNQCHVLPDPQRYTAKEWPAVVERMRENMAWMNRVVGSKDMPGEPQLTPEAINGFLARHARRPR
ncbi:MAG TPA: hypothetical protein VIS77_05765 [Burkholderiales bacterium]